jgi:type II secretory pathway pseudopilin PulG
MLVVIALITLLAGLVIPAVTRVRRQHRIAQARVTITTLQTALGKYVVGWGDYPPSGSFSMIEALLSVDPARGGPFITIKPRDLLGASPRRQMRDPWHRAGFPSSVYQYVYADGSPFLFGVTSTLRQVYIYSLGPDMVTRHPYGGGDDITSWR